MNIPNFLNFTALEDKEAQRILNQMENLVRRGEELRKERMNSAERSMEIYRNIIWEESDLKFFEEVGISPFQFPDHRVIISNIISKQRRQRFKFSLIPEDIDSYHRHVQGREQYITDNMHIHGSEEAAGEYFDRVNDDKYAKAVTAMLNKIRNENKAKYRESEVFQRGIVTGLDMFKCTYSTRLRRNGGIDIQSIPQRRIVFDENAVEYDLSDSEFIGEIHEIYISDIIKQFPDRKEELEKRYSDFTNKNKVLRTNKRTNQTYQNRYTFYNKQFDDKLLIVELWTCEIERRFMVYDKTTGEERMAEYGLEPKDIVDRLKGKELSELAEQRIKEKNFDPIDEEIENEIEKLVQEKYELYPTEDKVWYKTTFTDNALFEYTRSPLPTQSHPYYPYFAQHIDGYFSGLIDDLKDVIIALNKALGFRDLMMAHGAKGLLFVNADIMNKSGYDLDSISDAYTQVGGIMAIKLARGQNMADVAQSITTIGEGLVEINNIIGDLENRLMKISGVNLAQMGVTQGETPAARYRQQLQEADNNNGLLFDNFIRSLEGFYAEKVIPLVVDFMKERKTQVLREIGSDHADWIDVDLDDKFDVFESALYNGDIHLSLSPEEESAQLNNTRSAQRYELAAAGLAPVEWAVLHSDDPNKHEILKSLEKLKHEAAMRQAKTQVDIQLVQQLALQNPNMTPDMVNEFVKELQIAQVKELQKQKQTAVKGLEDVKKSGASQQTQQNLESQ